MEDYVDIYPERLYRPSEIERLLGRRCLEALRKEGLRATGGWYSGKMILDFFVRAAESRSRQRVPEERSVKLEKEHAKPLEKSSNGTRVQPLPRRHEPKPLPDQIAELRQVLETETKRAKRRKSA